ncbi:MAG: PIN domain-containing protein, partial [Campylobacteraceae bacterium]|nr:PIN domain-containing protein [Campylobacteraceae bacterium]
MYLIDANIIVRFLTADHEEHFQKAKEILLKVESREIEAKILDGVLAEIYFVLLKVYGLPKQSIIGDLKTVLSLDGIVGDNKIILFEALNILERKNIDFIDALICAKAKLQNYDILSF